MPRRKNIRQRNNSNARQVSYEILTKQSTPSEEMLWEMAFVLHLTEAIKEQLLAEKNGYPPNMSPAPFSYETSVS